MSVKDQISTDLKEAMKARDQVRLDTLRSVLSAFTYRRVEAGHDLTDDEQLALIELAVAERILNGGRTISSAAAAGCAGVLLFNLPPRFSTYGPFAMGTPRHSSQITLQVEENRANYWSTRWKAGGNKRAGGLYLPRNPILSRNQPKAL